MLKSAIQRPNITYYFLKNNNRNILIITNGTLISYLELGINQFINFNSFTRMSLFEKINIKQVLVPKIYSFTKIFFLINQVLYNNTKNMLYYYFNALKIIGVGYHFILSRTTPYTFISVGLTHLLVFRNHFATKPLSTNKKRNKLVFKSFSPFLRNECVAVTILKPIDVFSGKGIKIINTKIKRKVGKRSMR